MEKQFEKCVIEYYLHFVKFDEKWKELVKSVERPLSSLKNQSEQLRLVSDNSLDKTELCRDGNGLRGKLIFKINVAIEDEIAAIFDINSQLNNANQGLKNKLERLEAARSKVDPNSTEMKDLTIGTPQRPRLDLLMEWAIDCSNYYNELYSTINASVKKLDCKKEESVLNLMESFKEEKTKRAAIDRILGFTQFVGKEINQ